MPKTPSTPSRISDSSVTDADGYPHYAGDLTLLALFMDAAERRLPKEKDGKEHVTLIKRGFIIDRSKRVCCSSAEQAVTLASAATPVVCTFADPAPPHARSETELPEGLQGRYTIAPDALDEANTAACDVYYGWMDTSTADEIKSKVDGTIHV